MDWSRLRRFPPVTSPARSSERRRTLWATLACSAGRPVIGDVRTASLRQLLSRTKVFSYSAREVLQLSEEELRTLLQIYLASYSLYAVLLLTGALGSLTVLQLRVAMKKGRLVFAIAYWTLVGIVWFSLLRLLQFSKSIDTISQRLNLANLEVELQAEEVWSYYLFQWVFRNMYLIMFVAIGLSFVLFLMMWMEVERSAHLQGHVARRDARSQEAKRTQK
jgi:hypothetical protein